MSNFYEWYLGYDDSEYMKGQFEEEDMEAAYNAGVAQERERCLAICSKFTVPVYDGDDIAELIREGK